MMSARPVEQAPEPRSEEYSALFEKCLILCAFVTALLPIPVTLLGALPVYRIQGKFLAFYTPLVCFLSLGYLFYIRHSLARALLEGGFDRPWLPNPAKRESVSDSLVRVRALISAGRDLPREWGPREREPASAVLARRLRQARGVGFTVLPGVLILASVYCVFNYQSLLNESVAQYTVTYLSEYERAERQAEALNATSQGSTRRAANGSASRTLGDTATGLRGSYEDRQFLPAHVLSPVAAREKHGNLRNYLLAVADIDNIPFFPKLTVLYIGIFVTAELALLLMALKEYLKQTMALSEIELIVGPTPETEREEPPPPEVKPLPRSWSRS